MSVTDDFIIVDSCEDINEWSGTYDGSVSINTSRYREGSGSVNIYKTGTSSVYFGGKLTFSTPLDMSDKDLLLGYVYISGDLKNVVRDAYLVITDTNGTSVTFKRTDRLIWNDWAPLYAKKTGALNWGSIESVEFRFQTWSTSQTVPEGSINVDQIMVGNGYWILYTTDVNPHTLDDVYIYDREKGYNLIDKIADVGFVVKVPIRVGNGTDVGALKISKQVVVLDATQLNNFNEGVLWIYDNSFLIVENSVLIHQTNTYFPYGGGGFVAGSSVLRFTNTYYISTAPMFYGQTYRHNMRPQELSTNNFLTNAMLWMYTVTGFNPSGIFALLPRGSVILDQIGHPVDISATLYIFEGSEVVTRNSQQGTYHSVVLAGGQVRSDAGANSDVYNPVNASLDTFSATNRNSRVNVYYDTTLRVIDRNSQPVISHVMVYDKDGNLVFESDTNENGEVSTQLKVFYVYYDQNQGTQVKIDYNPFTVEVYINGTLLTRTKIEVYRPSTIYITPEDVYSVTTYPSSSSIQVGEEVTIYAKVQKIDGTPVTNASVYADITAPDDTIYTVTLKHTGNGVYAGGFDQTHLVGRYDIRTTVVMDNTTIEANNNFSAGRIESKIDEVIYRLKKHDEKMTGLKFV